MTKKLLQKTLNTYLLFSVTVMLVAAPLFYFISEALYRHEADEALEVGREEFLTTTLPKLRQSDVTLWNKINRDVKILPPSPLFPRDTLFYGSFYEKLTHENQPYQIMNVPIALDGKPYLYSAKKNLVENEDLIISIVLLFSILLFLLLGGLYLITRRLSLKFWSPFYATLEKIEQFKIDKDSTPEFARTDTEEFHRLNIAISELINRNIKIYKSQREFIDNAAHELQTPLAIFQAQVDSLYQDKDITRAQSAILGKLNDTVSRFNRLNKNLLLLSKLDSNHYEGQLISLNDLLGKNLDFFREQAKNKQIGISVDFPQDIELTTNLFLAEIIISNLFMNAIRHNIPNGNINVVLSRERLVFSNPANDGALAVEKLFGRFSKVDASSQGNGLGLAIIRKAAIMNRWSIAYRFEGGAHHFILDF